MSQAKDVTVNVTLGTGSNGQMTITSPGANDQETIWDNKYVTFSLTANSSYPNAYLLAVEFLDSDGNPVLDQDGPFKDPLAFDGNVQTRKSQVRHHIDSATWKYRVWVYDGTHIATHDPSLLNKKGG